MPRGRLWMRKERMFCQWPNPIRKWEMRAKWEIRWLLQLHVCGGLFATKSFCQSLVLSVPSSIIVCAEIRWENMLIIPLPRRKTLNKLQPQLSRADLCGRDINIDCYFPPPLTANWPISGSVNQNVSGVTRTRCVYKTRIVGGVSRLSSCCMNYLPICSLFPWTCYQRDSNSLDVPTHGLCEEMIADLSTTFTSAQTILLELRSRGTSSRPFACCREMGTGGGGEIIVTIERDKGTNCVCAEDCLISRGYKSDSNVHPGLSPELKLGRLSQDRTGNMRVAQWRMIIREVKEGKGRV